MPDGCRAIDHPNFEIVIVADQSGIDAVNAHALGDQVKLVLFDEMNISAARNAGVAAAAGEIITFIDDDAIPEPTWLTHLIAPFADESVAVAGRYVIGRNGISFQWKARTVYPDAHTEDLILYCERPQVFEGSPTRAIKTEGTNMAVRRDVLVHLGGFDPAFRFYLDETDLNMRIGKAGSKTAIVPLSQVHHGFAPSAWRRDDRFRVTCSRSAQALRFICVNMTGTSPPFRLNALHRDIVCCHIWWQGACCRQMSQKFSRHLMSGGTLGARGSLGS